MTRLEEIKERLSKASLGPWHFNGRQGSIYDDCEDMIFEGNQDGMRGPQEQEDGEFLAHTREDIPWLLEHIKSLEFMSTALKGGKLPRHSTT